MKEFEKNEKLVKEKIGKDDRSCFPSWMQDGK